MSASSITVIADNVISAGEDGTGRHEVTDYRDGRLRLMNIGDAAVVTAVDLRRLADTVEAVETGRWQPTHGLSGGTS